MTSIRVLVLLATMALSATTASAGTLTWTLTGVTSLGSTITGSFDFNANTTTYSDINITTSGGSIIPNFTWSQHASFGSFSCCLAMVDTTAIDETGADVLNLGFASDLTNAGGTIPISFTQQGTCNSPNPNPKITQAARR